MGMNRPTIAEILDTLASHSGEPRAPEVTTPLEMILWENVAYLADDDRRMQAFDLLAKSVGLQPEEILSASDAQLLAVAQYGILPQTTVDKLRKIASIALADFPDGLGGVLELPNKLAMRALKKFPAIGEPAAEKILLFTGTEPILALESNGLRVLQRIGFGAETGNYTADYRAVRADTASGIPKSCPELIRAHQLLRRHGQQVCRRGVPRCGSCPLVKMCRYGASEPLHGN